MHVTLPMAPIPFGVRGLAGSLQSLAVIEFDRLRTIRVPMGGNETWQ